MTTRKTQTTSRTKSGTLKKSTVKKAVRNVSTTRREKTSSEGTVCISRDAKTGRYTDHSEVTINKSKASGRISKTRSKSGGLKRTVVKDAVVSVSKSRPKQKKTK